MTVSVKQAAVPLHCGPVAGGLPPGGLPDELLLGPYAFKRTAVTSTIPRTAMITTARARGIRLFERSMPRARVLGILGFPRPESGPGQIWTGDLPVISRTLQPG